MKYTFAVVLTFAQLAFSSPTLPLRQTYEPCSGVSGSAQCCATDVLGLVDLDCGNPPSTPGTAADFSSICAAIGQRARCCLLPILDQGIVCQTPMGVDD